MERDRNLLFGIFAVQIKGVSPRQIVEAGAAWATDPTTSLSQQLVRLGALSEPDAALIERLVDAAVAGHQGDASQALASLGGDAQVDKTFHGSLIPRPSGGLETRPMVFDTDLGEPAVVLSTVEEMPGRYSHISEYGRGGMGRVLLVHDEHMGRDVALKELLMPKSEWSGPGESPAQASAGIAARFLQEARLTGKLAHPAIVPVYELGRRSNGTLYYTMKLVRGKTLSRVFKECTTLQQRLALLNHFVDICQAIAYAHSRGVIHRDIKPANIMVGEFGETVVLDWGLAKGRDVADVYGKELESTIRNLRLKLKSKPDVTPFETRVGEAVGTPNYMAPEQAEGRIGDINEQSDVYSLGVVLFELLTGEVPFDAATAEQVLWRLLNEPAPRIAALEPAAPPELIEVCNKAMSKDPARRYSSAAELAADVKRFMTGSMVKAYQYTPAQILWRYYRQNRLVLNTVAVAIAAFLVLGTYSYVNILNARNREHGQRVVAEEATMQAEAARAAETVARGEAERREYVSNIRLAQEYLRKQNYAQAREILWSTQEGLRGLEWSLQINQAYPDRFLVHAAGTSVYGAKFSPDGRHIATLSWPDPPRIYDAQTGDLLVTMKSASGNPSTFNFSPDGTRLLVGDNEGHIHFWDTAGGDHLQDILAHKDVVDTAVFSADNKEILSAAMDGTVRLWNAHTGALEHEIANADSSGIALLSPDNTLIALECSNGKVMLYDHATLTLRAEIVGTMARFSADSTVLATVVNGKDIALWSSADAHALGQLNGHTEPVTAMRFDTKGPRLLSTAADRTVRLWNTENFTQLRRMVEMEVPLDAVFTADTDKILSYLNNNQMNLWDVGSGVATDHFLAAGSTATMLDLDTAASRVVVTGSQDSFQVWDILQPPGRVELTTPGERPSRRATMSPDGFSFACADATDVTVRDTESGHLQKHFAAFSLWNAFVMAFSADGERLVSVPDGFTAVVWDLRKNRWISTFQNQDGRILCAAYSPKSNTVVTGSTDHTACLWNAQNGETVATLRGHTGSVEAVAFAPDGRTVATGSRDGSIALWDTETGNRTHVLNGHVGAVLTLAFGRGGDRLISGGEDYLARVWNVATGAEIQQIGAHAANVDRVGYELNDHYIFTSGWDNATRLWDAQSYDLLADLPGTSGAQIGGNGTLVTMSTARNSIQRWNLPPLSKEALPGAAGQSWEQRFAIYRRQENIRNTGRAPKAEGSQSRYFMAPADRLADRFRALAEAAPTLGPDASGLCLDGVAPDVVVPLGLPKGACIAMLNGAPLHAAGDLAEAAAALHPDDPSATLKLGLRLDTQEIAMEYSVLSVKSTEKTATLSPADAVALLRGLQTNAELQRGNFSVNPVDYAPAMGIELYFDAQLTKDSLKKAGLWDRGRLVGLEGAAITDFDLFKGDIDRLIAEIEQTKAPRRILGLAFQQGEFKRIAAKITIEDSAPNKTP